MTVEQALALVEGTPVVACRPDGYMIEGNVVEVQPYDCKEVLPDWDEPATIVIKDNTGGHISHWRPGYVEVVS
jgi:hypothetical protein